MTKHQHIQGAVDRVPGLDHSMESAHLSDLSAPSDKLSEESVARVCRAHTIAAPHTVRIARTCTHNTQLFTLRNSSLFNVCVCAVSLFVKQRL